MRLPRLLILVALVATAEVAADSSLPTPARVSAALVERAKRLWLGLPRSKMARGCGDFDYFPEGGMRNFYCHLLPEIGWREVQRLFGQAVFVSGPHRSGKLNLTSRTSFGHYNPAFVRWVADVFIPGSQDAAFRAATQPIYDQDLRFLARIYYVTHQKLQGDRAYLEREKRALLSAMMQHGVGENHYGKYFDFMGDGWDGNVVDTAVAFWIRRSIDGTDAEFFAGLSKLIAVYDPSFGPSLGSGADE